MNDDEPEISEEVDRQAAAWVVRRDRGFTPAEREEFQRWLAGDPARTRSFERQLRTWRELDLLRDPAPARLQPRRLWRQASLLALAATVVFAAVLAWRQQPPAPVATEARAAAGVERQRLPDGSWVDLNRGARLEVDFSPEERRVRLRAGEAHFEVQKDPHRPFVVEAAGVRVSAVGTAFNVALADERLAVIVTEGVVRIQPPEAPKGQARAEPRLAAAGQRVLVDLAAPEHALEVAPLTAEQMARALAWKPQLLEFRSQPLGEVAAEFNRHNTVQIVIEDPALAAWPIVASFHSDNVEGFVRLLEASAGVRATRTGDTIVLRRAGP